jgi:choice-of-anchor A domain-containing protein
MKSKVICFLVAAVASLMLFGNVGAHAGVVYENGNPVYKASDAGNLLGIAADFGIFADEVDLSADAETNAACNHLSFATLRLTTNGIIYAGEFKAKDGQNLQYSKRYQQFLPKVETLDVYVGKNHTLSQNTDKTWNVNNHKVNCNEISVNFIKEGSVPFIDVNTELNRLTDLACSLAKLPDSGASYQWNNENDRSIECNEGVNVLNLSYKDLVNEGHSFTEIRIYGIRDTENTLLINITGLEGVEKVSIPKICFGTNSIEDSIKAKHVSQILWNFADFAGYVKNAGEFGGTILAPKANVNVGAANLLGSVIARKFTNDSGEIHFVPNKVKKDSSVQVSIKSVDGTCCPSVEISDVKAVLYKKNGKKYEEVSSAMTGADGFATWTIKEAGEYYIREVQGQEFEDFAETPIKCYFTVKNEDGILRVYKKDKAKEGNGENTTFKYTGNADEKNSAYFKLRHYSNSLYLAANLFGEDNSFTLVSSEYDFTVTNLDKNYIVTVDMAKGLADESGEAYNIKEAHIKEAGRYRVDMLSKDRELLDTKYVDVYLLPVGSYTFVEKEFGDLADAYIGYLGKNYNISKLSATNQKGIKALAGEAAFDTMTDGCLFFNFENADIIS